LERELGLPGYDNEWYQAIRIMYSGSGILSFDYLLDSEADYDFVCVELDSACSSNDRVDYDIDPRAAAWRFRDRLVFESGLQLQGQVSSLAVDDFGTTDTHCLYIAFFSDGGVAPCDGFMNATLGAGLVVDNIALTGVVSPVSEDFDGTLDPNIEFVNVAAAESFGEWGRTFSHITDNDVCTENTTCAWLWSDHTTPTIANDPSMAFGPGGFVVRSWLDNMIVSPWVSLATTPTAKGTILQFRILGGNYFAATRLLHQVSVRERYQGLDPILGGTIDCVHNWQQIGRNRHLDNFSWETDTRDITTNFLQGPETEIQVRHRLVDLQVFGVPAPIPYVPGPGPYIDRTRIGRLVVDGPLFRPRGQAQDAFPTEVHPSIPLEAGEHFRPTTNRFGSAAFSARGDLAGGGSPHFVTHDSIVVAVVDVRESGGFEAVDWYGAIVEGPHRGKAPPPWSTGANGFFQVAPDTVFESAGDLIRIFSVDLDDLYFRGGDVLRYFWLATDFFGGISSFPEGLSNVPVSIEAAQTATEGLLEVSFLPKIDWDPGYLARVAADPHGKLDPTEEELANSTQSNCILYYQRVNPERRSGDVNRTTFMYTLDRLGYRGRYDVVDSSHLGALATVQQAQGYNLIIYDVGNNAPTGNIMPDGSDPELQKVDQAGWFRSWLTQAATSEAGFATFWMIGSDALQERPTEPLYTVNMGVVLNATNQGLSANPDVDGQASFSFSQGGSACTADFAPERYSLEGGCPTIRDYDALGTSGSGTATHRYRDPVLGGVGDAAIVMNSNGAEAWNTVFQSHAWFDIRDPFGEAPVSPGPQEVLLNKILGCALPIECQQSPNPTDAPHQDPAIDRSPARTALYQNVPNPFNPTTTISFDLARDAHVRLHIYDVTGHLVRQLVEERLERNRHEVVWDGMNDAGLSVSSGIYFYRLETASFTDTRKLVIVR
jgi:hypothetical protein